MKLFVALILLALVIGGHTLGRERKTVEAYEPPKWIDDVLVTKGYKIPSGEYVKKPETDEDLLDFESVDKAVEEEKKAKEKRQREETNRRIREHWMLGDDEGRIETV